MNFEVIEILDSVLNSKGRKLKKQNEYMYWSPFVSHHKPKLQVNIETGKWHCWVSNQGGHNLFQLLKRIGASRTYYQKLSEIVGDTRYVKKEEKEYTLKFLSIQFLTGILEIIIQQELGQLKEMVEQD